MYSVMIIIAAVLAIQCLCSLIYLVRLKRVSSSLLFLVHIDVHKLTLIASLTDNQAGGHT